MGLFGSSGLKSAGASIASVIAGLAGQAISALRYTATAPNGTDAFIVSNNGARVHFGGGANDFASSDGTTVTFNGPVATASGAANSIASGATSTNVAFSMVAGAGLQWGSAASFLTSDGSGRLTFAATAPAMVIQNFTDGSGTTGNQTINTVRGMGAFAGATSTVTITNSQCLDSTRLVLVTLLTNDATAVLKNVVPGAGSFTVNLTANATGTTKFGWMIFL